MQHSGRAAAQHGIPAAECSGGYAATRYVAVAVNGSERWRAEAAGVCSSRWSYLSDNAFRTGNTAELEMLTVVRYPRGAGKRRLADGRVLSGFFASPYPPDAAPWRYRRRHDHHQLTAFSPGQTPQTPYSAAPSRRSVPSRWSCTGGNSNTVASDSSAPRSLGQRRSTLVCPPRRIKIRSTRQNSVRFGIKGSYFPLFFPHQQDRVKKAAPVNPPERTVRRPVTGAASLQARISVVRF